MEDAIEEQLKESRREFHTLFNLLPDPVVIVDGKGKFLAVNDRVEDMTGFSKQELLGRNFLRTRVVTARSKAILTKNLAKRMLGMNIDPYEVEVLAKDGRKIVAEVNARKIRYRRTPADLVIFRDITGRRKAEELYRKIFELSPESIVTVDLKGVITSCNDAATKMLGFSSEEMIGRHFLRIGIIRARDVPRFLKLFDLVLKGNVNKPLELTFKHKDGTTFLAEVRVSLLKAGNESIGVQAISRDITSRKKAEEALRKSEEQYRRVVEHSLQGIVIVQDSRVVYANEASAKITGYTVRELLSFSPEKVMEMVPLEDKALVWQRFRDRLAGKTVPRHCEYRVVRKDGTVVWLETFAHRILHNGQPAVQAAIVDITERKKAEKVVKHYSEHLEELVEERTSMLKKTQEKLLKAQRLAAVGEAVAMVGHDLRNPLQSIGNAAYYLNNMLSDLPVSQKGREMLHVINDSINYADKIMRDLQDFSATKEPRLKKANINDIVEEILSQIRVPENVELITELRRLPEMRVDRDMMKRVFLNLASNGIQAMEKGGTLKVSTDKAEGSVQISFEDTGMGVSRESIGEIFTPFFTTKSKGMGMGLAICKKFIKAHHGGIEVESEEGRGSAFTVRLPLK